jgi:hypothetical protein
MSQISRTTKKELIRGVLICLEPSLEPWQWGQYKRSVKVEEAGQFMCATQNQKRWSTGPREPSATPFKMILSLPTWNRLPWKRKKISETTTGRNRWSLSPCRETNLYWRTQKSTSSVAIDWFQTIGFLLTPTTTTSTIKLNGCIQARQIPIAQNLKAKSRGPKSPKPKRIQERSMCSSIRKKVNMSYTVPGIKKKC